MSALKRTATASRTAGLTAQASAYHASVTLFDIPDLEATELSEPPSPRRSKRVKVETDFKDAVQDTPKSNIKRLARPSAPASSIPKKRASKSPRKPKLVQQSLERPHPAPERWRETYDAIKKMRSRIVAPVDTMGCEQAQLKEDDPKNRRFATLISLMLSSQTKDEVTDAAVSNLRSALGGSLTVDGIIQTEESTISEAIGKVGFWRRKTVYIKQTAQHLRDKFDSDVPKTVDELCSLPGVGPKMAFLTLQVAWNLNVGIGVDVHVHRITNRLGWHKPSTKTPEETRLNLQSWLPIELHPEINHRLVGFGQTICLPVRPRCDLCDLSTAGLCPSAQKVTNSKNRKAVIIAPLYSTSESPAKIEVELEVEERKPALPKLSSVKQEHCL